MPARRKLLFLALWGLAPLGVHAEEPVNTGSIQDVYNHLTRVLAKAESLEFYAVYQAAETELGPKFKHLPPDTSPRSLTAEVNFLGRGGKYFYTEDYAYLTVGGGTSNDLAWDGRYYQVLNHKNGYLLFSRFDPDHNHLALKCYTPLNMFGFLMSQEPTGQQTISWDVVKNVAAWRSCLAGARLVGPTNLHGKPCSVVTIPVAEYRNLHVPRCTCTVYFSWNDGMFPLAWKIADEYGRVLQDYEVEEFGEVKLEGALDSFYYPKKAKGSWYPDKDFPPGSPYGSFTSQTESFRLNTIADDKVFSIDRTKVHEIYNADSGVVMAVHQ